MKNKTQQSPRQRGGQPGNQNARVHGFYSDALTPAQQEQLKVAGGLRGVDDEIAMLRVKIRSILDNDADNSAVLLRAITALTRLVKVRSLRSPDDKMVNLALGVRQAFQDIAAPLGITAEEFFALQDEEIERQQARLHGNASG